MPKQKLQNSVEELRTEITQNADLEDTHKQELSDLAARLDTMISGDADHWEEKLVDGLEQKLLQYEEEHPVVARIMQEIITTLSNIGV